MIHETRVKQARNSDMLLFFSQHNGFTFRKKGGEYRCVEHPSLAVKSDCLSWYWHSKGVGGYGTLDFLIKVEGYSFREAVEQFSDNHAVLSEKPEPNDTTKTLILPEKAGRMYKRLYAYLCKTRGIDGEIISKLIQEKKIYEDKRGNVVFIGYDEKNIPKFACLRGTYTHNQFRMDCAGSNKQYGFRMTYNETDKLYIFEAPIDAMSHATLTNLVTGNTNAWRNDNRLSLGGVTSLALDKYIELHHQTKELIFCLDNDTAGREAAVFMVRKYTDKGFCTRMELPESKDYNTDLLEYRNKQRTGGIRIDYSRTYLKT